jgi:chromosome segregation ATPase
MSREDLKTHIRDLTHELQLSTYINKGAIQEGQELKARLAELERENAALRTTERRLTETEEKLEECQQMVREKEGQIKRLKDATSGLKNALKEASRQRDDWSRTWEQMRQFMDAKDAAMARSESPDTTGSAIGTASTSVSSLCSARYSPRH